MVCGLVVWCTHLLVGRGRWGVGQGGRVEVAEVGERTLQLVGRVWAGARPASRPPSACRRPRLHRRRLRLHLRRRRRLRHLPHLLRRIPSSYVVSSERVIALLNG